MSQILATSSHKKLIFLKPRSDYWSNVWLGGCSKIVKIYDLRLNTWYWSNVIQNSSHKSPVIKSGNREGLQRVGGCGSFKGKFVRKLLAFSWWITHKKLSWGPTENAELSRTNVLRFKWLNLGQKNTFDITRNNHWCAA